MVNKGDLKDLEKRMDQRDKNLMAFIKEEFATNNQAINQAIKEMMGGLNLRLDKIEEDVKELSKKMEEDKKEQIARDRKRNNIVIYGLTKGGETEEKHDLKEKVDRVTEQLKLENEDIKFCRRIGEKLVLVGFHTRTSVELAHARKKKLEGSIRISEDLTMEQRKEYRKIQQLAEEKSKSGEEYILVGPRSCPRMIKKTCWTKKKEKEDKFHLNT